MNTRSKTTGAPPAAKDTRSDSNAGAPRLPPPPAPEPHRGHGLARPLDHEAELELEHLVERGRGEVGPHHLVADVGRQERALEAHRVAVPEAQPLDRGHPRAPRPGAGGRPAAGR